MITVDELKAMPLDEPIGEAVVCDIERMANEGLQPFYQREFEPYEGVYRVNDFEDELDYLAGVKDICGGLR